MADYRVHLDDDFSGPIEKSRDALGRFVAGTKQAQGAVAGFGRAMGLSEGAVTRAVTVGNLLAAGYQKLASAALGAARAAGRIAIAFGSKLAASIRTSEGLSFSLTKFLGSGKLAQKEIDALAEQSNQLGINFAKAGTNFKDFISAGASTELAHSLIAFKADLIALGDGSQDALGRVDNAFFQLQKAMGMGKIEADGFQSILDQLPINKMQVLEVLAKKTGKSLAELQKTEITKLPVKELVESFQEATLAATGFGKAGELAIEKQMSTMSGLVDAIKNRAVNAFDILAAKVGPQLAQKLGPTLNKIGDSFDSPQFFAGIEAMASGVVGFVGFVVDALPVVIQEVKRFASGIADGFAAAFGGADQMTATFGAFFDIFKNAEVIEGMKRMLKGLGAVVGFVAGVVVELGMALATVFAGVSALVGMGDEAIAWFSTLGSTISSGVGAAVSAVGGLFSSIGTGIMDFAAGVVDSAFGVGSAIVNGIASGIMAFGSAVANALFNVVRIAIDEVKGRLGINSPSKVFMELGTSVPEGFSMGIEGGLPDVLGSMQGMSAPPPATGVSLMGGGGGIGSVQINIDTSGAMAAAATTKDPATFAAAVQNMITNDFLDSLEGLLAEASGSL